MMRLQTYAGFSFMATVAVIYHAFHSRQQFYPAMVYLSTSKICFVLLLNMGLVLMFTLWQLVKRVFLGTLREAEVERLNELAWREVMEILFAITIFRQDFSVISLATVAALLLIKALHWLAQKRVEYIETTPSVTLLSHIRIVSFMVFLFVVDCVFLHHFFKLLLQSRTASLPLFFSFEYTILASTMISTLVKYVFYVSDMLMEGQWEKKAVFTFYLELIRDLFHLTLYICFFLVICACSSQFARVLSFLALLVFRRHEHHNAPLHLIRELYDTFRSFRTRVADYIRYRRVTSNMDERFPDATAEELNSNDSTCIICREEMLTAKKLSCGHLFHVHCLRSWLERQNTCPTCRALVVPENGAARSSRRGPPSESQAGSTGASRPAGDKFSQHQARLEAASFAASIYGKSFIHSSASSSFGSPGFSFLPQLNIPDTDVSALGTKENRGESASGSFQQDQFSVSNEHLRAFMPPQVPVSGFTYGARGLENRDLDALKAYESSIRSRIEMLRKEEEVLRQQLEDSKSSDQQEAQSNSSSGDAVPTAVDAKGKAVAASD